MFFADPRTFLAGREQAQDVAVKAWDSYKIK
jgi:hypothetical protein